MLNLTDEQRKEIFFKHKDKSSYKIAQELGLDKEVEKIKDKWKNKTELRQRINTEIYTVYKNIKNNPKKFGLTEFEVKAVTDAVEGRRIAPKYIKELKLDTDKTIEKLIPKIANTAGALIEIKLNEAMKNKRLREKLSIKDLTTLAIAMFDKTRILNGEATQHIAIASKVSIDMSADEALREALAMKSKMVENYNNKK